MEILYIKKKKNTIINILIKKRNWKNKLDYVFFLKKIYIYIYIFYSLVYYKLLIIKKNRNLL